MRHRLDVDHDVNTLRWILTKQFDREEGIERERKKEKEEEK